MKKLLQIAFAAVLALLLPTAAAFAAVAPPMEMPVTAQSVQNADWSEAPVEQGRADLVLEDGTRVSVSGVEPDGLTLVVYAIPRSDEQAWMWIKDGMEDYGTNLYPLELYFVDSQGGRVDALAAFTVTLSGPWEYKAPAVFFLSQDGAVTRLNTQVDGAALTFRADRTGYFVPAETEDMPEKSDGSDGSTQSDGGTQSGGTQSGGTQSGGGSQSGGGTQSDGASPKAGDDGQPLVWCALLLACGGVCFIGLSCAKKWAKHRAKKCSEK